MVYYLSMFLFTFIFTVFSIPLFKKLAYKWNIVDCPDERKIHTFSIPYLGGIPIYLSFALVLFFILKNPLYKQFNFQIIGLLLGSTGIVILGLVDDIKKISPKQKLLGQILCASILYFFKIRINFLTNPFGGEITLNFLSFPLTIFWIVLLINSINLIDGLDGLCAGICFIASSSLFAISLGQKDPFLTVLSISLAGTTLGFLKHNFYPAKIFMGDTGSMFLGFILASMAIMSGGKKIGTSITLLVPIVIFGLPFLDTFIAIIRRTKNKQNIFKPDKRHLHHRLLIAGFTHKQVVLAFYFMSICFGIVSYILTGIPKNYAIILFIVLWAVAIFLLEALEIIETRIESYIKKK